MSTTRGAQRTRLFRWVAAVGLLAAAEDQRAADIPETNAMGLLAAHAACEAMLGLLIGSLPSLHPSKDDRSFEVLLQAAKPKARPRLTSGLIDDLRAMHRTRNAFVHGGTSVDGIDLDRAIEASHDLAARLPLPGSRAIVGTPTVVADMIDIEFVGMWLRHADRLRRERQLRLSADGIARALDSALARSSPHIRTRTGLSMRDTIQRMTDLGRGRYDRRELENAVDAINSLTQWVLPMAIATPPAVYEYVRSIVGFQTPLDLGGHPGPVTRPTDDPPTEADLKRASTLVSQIIFRLWAIGSLKAGQYDQQLVEIARPFLENPSGFAAGEPDPRVPPTP